MLDYAMLASTWTEDVEGYDIDNRSWFRVRNGLLGRITEFFEADGVTPYYAIDVYVLALDGSVVFQEIVRSEDGRYFSRMDARNIADNFMANF